MCSSGLVSESLDSDGRGPFPYVKKPAVCFFSCSKCTCRIFFSFLKNFVQGFPCSVHRSAHALKISYLLFPQFVFISGSVRVQALQRAPNAIVSAVFQSKADN